MWGGRRRRRFHRLPRSWEERVSWQLGVAVFTIPTWPTVWEATMLYEPVWRWIGILALAAMFAGWMCYAPTAHIGFGVSFFGVVGTMLTLESAHPVMLDAVVLLLLCLWLAGTLPLAVRWCALRRSASRRAGVGSPAPAGTGPGAAYPSYPAPTRPDRQPVIGAMLLAVGALATLTLIGFMAVGDLRPGMPSRNELGRILDRWYYTVTEAGSGCDATSCFRRYRVYTALYLDSDPEVKQRKLADWTVKEATRYWRVDASWSGCAPFGGTFDDRTICLKVDPYSDHVLVEFRIHRARG